MKKLASGSAAFAMSQHFPEWLSDQSTPDQLVKLASTAFAAGDRRFPLHTPTDAYYSALDYFRNIQEVPEKVGEQIKKAAATYGILDDLQSPAEYFAVTFEKSASEELVTGEFAIDEELDGSLLRMLPINNDLQVKNAAADLQRMAVDQRIPYAMFVAASRNIVKQASDLGVSLKSLPVVVYDAGDSRTVDPDELPATLLKLAEERKSPHLEELSKMAAAGADPDTLLVALSSAEESLGRRYRYNERGLQDMPHNLIFTGPRESEINKAAAEQLLVGDLQIPYQAFRKIPDEELYAKLSEAAGESVLELKKTASTAHQVSLEVMEWREEDRKTLLRLAVKHG